MALTTAQSAEIARLNRLRLWLEAGADDTARKARWRQVVTERRAEVDRIVADALARICVSREHAAVITRTREAIGDPVPDIERRLELAEKADAAKHLMPAGLVADIMTALQDDVDLADPDAYNELRRVPLKPGVGDPTTAEDAQAAIDAIIGGA